MGQYKSAAFIFVFLATISSFSLLGLGNSFGLDTGIEPVQPREPLDLAEGSNRIADAINISYVEDKALDDTYFSGTITGWQYNSTQANGQNGILYYNVDDLENVTITTVDPDDGVLAIDYCVEGSNADFGCPKYQNLFGDGKEVHEIDTSAATAETDELRIRWHQTDLFRDADDDYLIQISSGSVQAGTFDYVIGAFTGLFAIGTANPIIGLFMAVILVVAALIIRHQFRV